MKRVELLIRRRVCVLLLLAALSVGSTKCVFDPGITDAQVSPDVQSASTPFVHTIMAEDDVVYLPLVARIAPPLQIRGGWLQAGTLSSPQAVDEVLTDVVRGGFDTLFITVFRMGKAFYDSQLVARSDDLPEDFDPLSYLLPQTEALGIEVHAWFVVGQVGWPTLASEPVSIFQEHPEWMAINACGVQSKWLSAAHPGAQDFIRDLVAEFLQSYSVDGVHLDYIRYPGEGWSFDAESLNRFQTLYNVDPENIRQSSLPARAYYTGHPLIWPSTAEVLAVFDSGDPALTLNAFGDGEVIVFNWDATRCEVAAAGVIFQRALERLTAISPDVYLLEVEGAGSPAYRNARSWLDNMGWSPVEITSAVVPTLTPSGVIVLPNVYSVPVSLAESLQDFVWAGGNVIFLDGPASSMDIAEIRGLTGMQMVGKSFARNPRWLWAPESHPLLPDGGPAWDETISQQWIAFRSSNILQWVQSVREETNLHPDVQLSAAVFADLTSASMVGQDWLSWLANGSVDWAMPMAHAEDDLDLVRFLLQWQDSPYVARIAPGLIVYDSDTGISKSSQAVLEEISLARSSGAQAVVLFDLEHMDHALLDALSAGPFASEGVVTTP